MVVQTTDVLGSTAVKTGDGRRTVCTVVAGGGEAQINAAEELLEGGLVNESLVSGIGVGVDRSYVEVAYAGTCEKTSSDNKNTGNIFKCFHIADRIRSLT